MQRNHATPVNDLELIESVLATDDQAILNEQVLARLTNGVPLATGHQKADMAAGR